MEEQNTINYTIETQELADLMMAKPESLTILWSAYASTKDDSAGIELFEKHHIPGSVYFSIFSIADNSTDLMAMLPEKDEFISQMKRLGVKKNNTIVIYDYEKILVSPRVSWMLRTYGAKDVRILNGCLKKWIDEGRELKRGKLEDPNDTAEEGYDYEFNPTMKINLRPMLKKIYSKQGTLFCSDFIVEEGNDDVQFFDSRGKEDFESGHPPEFISLPFTTILDNERSFKSAEDLRKIMDEYNISTEKETIISCRRGVTAWINEVAFLIAGVKSISIYDGSWSEYTRYGHPDFSVENWEDQYPA